MSSEIWVEIEGYEDFYEISSRGRIRTKEKMRLSSKRRYYCVPSKNVHPWYKDGKLTVWLYDGEKKQLYDVQDLVDKHFDTIIPVSDTAKENKPEDITYPSIIEKPIPETLRNTRKRPAKKVGTPGVYYDTRINKWTARIIHKGKYVYIGSYLKEEDAVNKRKIAMDLIKNESEYKGR
jgi:hypothetical protein